MPPSLQFDLSALSTLEPAPWCGAGRLDSVFCLHALTANPLSAPLGIWILEFALHTEHPPLQPANPGFWKVESAPQGNSHRLEAKWNLESGSDGERMKSVIC